MFDVFVLNIVVFLFALLTIAWQRGDLKLKKTEKVSKRINPIFLLIFVIVWLFILLYILISSSNEFRSSFLTVNLSILLVANSLWISAGKNIYTKIFAVSLTVCLLLLKFTIKNQFIDNLFIFMSALWVGPFLIKINLITKKRFIVISLIWLIYDIYFVWLSPTFKNLNFQTQAVNFTLGVVIGKYLIGVGDLLYMNILLSALNDNKSRVLASFVLILTNIGFLIFALKTEMILTFPLLVLWAPLGILLIFFFRKSL